MRIVIDLQGAQSESRFRGIGRYSLSLALAITKNAGEHEIWLVLNGAFPESVIDICHAFEGLIPSERIQVYEIPLPVAESNSQNHWRTKVSELIRENFLQQLNPDVVLVSSLFEGYVDNSVTSIGQLDTKINTVVILYDLIPYLNPEKYLADMNYREFYMKKIEFLKQAGLLLSISAFSKKEAHSVLKIDENKIHNISTAVDECFQPIILKDSQIEQLYQRYGIERKMIMYAPGGFDIRKNFENLITAYSMLLKEHRTKHQLVIVSKIQEVEKQNLYYLAKKAGLAEDELIITGYVPDEDLIALYNMVTLFVFPSIHEGFGLPILEAMSCGAPVIGSNSTSIPEVIGWEEALFDPDLPKSISQKIEQALEDESWKNQLVENEKKQVSIFSWDLSAKRALASIEEYFQEKEHAIQQDNWHSKLTKFQNNYLFLIEKIASLIKSYNLEEKELKSISRAVATNYDKLEYLLRKGDLPERINWRIEGPFDSTYSLALLNRETALALEQLGHNVVLHSTEGPGDFKPVQEFLDRNPKTAKLYEKSFGHIQEEADITSRNLYPPRVHDIKSRINLLHHYAWEESAFPQKWVEDFNQSLQGITCLSTHVEKIMLDNGVIAPLSTSGCGVDHWERIVADENYKLEDDHKFRFLHVSSCFPRKGVDVLLKAFGKAFSITDDVVLIIKTFPNPHNEVHKLLENARINNNTYPDVIIIEEDLTEGELKSLYQQCHTLVGPSRAEGFGLPFAEAMLSDLPVITTGWSGQLDFCNVDTAWLIDYTFTLAKTHFELYNSVWAEPSEEHLAKLMREVYELPEEIRSKKPKKARELLLSKFKWKNAVGRLVKTAKQLSLSEEPTEPKIGWVTSWNTKCGIAAYSEHLINGMYKNVSILGSHSEQLIAIDKNNVHRCWYSGEDDNLTALDETIESLELNTIVIQFNYGFFNFESLSKFIDNQIEQNRVVVMMMHATTDPVHILHKRLDKLVPVLQKCDRLLVHAIGDLNRLKSLSLVNNVALFPHGILDWSSKKYNKTDDYFIVSSYGFFLPHKGLIELIDAVSHLIKNGNKIKLKMINAEYPVPESALLVQEARKKIQSLKLSKYIELTTDFLSDKESLQQLSNSDLIIFPYQETGESSSAAVRYGLAAGKPVAVTPLSIFDDVSSAVFKLSGTNAQDIAKGIEFLMNEIKDDSQMIQNNNMDTERWRSSHRYSSLGNRITNILIALLNQKIKKY